jgi:hypothetical protein
VTVSLRLLCEIHHILAPHPVQTVLTPIIAKHSLRTTLSDPYNRYDYKNCHINHWAHQEDCGLVLQVVYLSPALQPADLSSQHQCPIYSMNPNYLSGFKYLFNRNETTYRNETHIIGRETLKMFCSMREK